MTPYGEVTISDSTSEKIGKAFKEVSERICKMKDVESKATECKNHIAYSLERDRG